MAGYMTGIVEQMPRGRKRGLIRSDSGTPFTFSLSSSKVDAPTPGRKMKVTLNSRVLFRPGENRIAHDIKISIARHSYRGMD